MFIRPVHAVFSLSFFLFFKKTFIEYFVCDMKKREIMGPPPLYYKHRYFFLFSSRPVCHYFRALIKDRGKTKLWEKRGGLGVL